MRTQPILGDFVRISSYDKLLRIGFLNPATLKQPSQVIGIEIYIDPEDSTTGTEDAIDKLLAMFGLKKGHEIIPGLYILIEKED